MVVGWDSPAVRWRLTEGVPDEDVRQLFSIARRRRFARQEVVYHRGDPADSMHLIVKGHFAVQVTTPWVTRRRLGWSGRATASGNWR